MAIQAKIITCQGVALDTAYINIVNTQLIKTTTAGVNTYQLGGNASIYVNKATYEAGNIPLEGFSVVCDADLTKPVPDQIYAELKLNSRLSNITDC